MTFFQHQAEVPGRIDEVFAWHTRPGALVRLAPPWQPVRVLQEATSLRDGTAVLGLPAGLRWVATHQPAGYLPPHRFTDELTSFPLATVLNWRHEHQFEHVGSDRTRVTDLVWSRVPHALLRPMFAYRARQLAGDLTAHRWAARLRPEPLTVAVSGSSGLIGSALCALLTTGGHRVIRLVRYPTDEPDARRWNPDDPAADLLDGVDVLIHLAGASIAGRFTESHRRRLRDSRIEPTRRLARLAAATARRGGPLKFVCASAIGFYGPDRGDEVLTEESERGEGFVADVVDAWEAATGPASDAGVPVTLVRTGIVQTPAGGPLRLQRPLFEIGAGGRLGDGDQWTAWIGLDDVLDVYLRAAVDPDLTGPVNAVAPHPVRNTDYTATLGRVLRRPVVIPTPSFGPRILLGEEGARELAFANQRVHPRRLTEIGHPFRYPELEGALRHLLGKTRPRSTSRAATHSRPPRVSPSS